MCKSDISLSPDAEEALRLLRERFEAGEQEYGVLSVVDDERADDWLAEAIEELLDACAYLMFEVMRLRREMKQWQTERPSDAETGITSSEGSKTNEMSPGYSKGDATMRTLAARRMSPTTSTRFRSKEESRSLLASSVKRWNDCVSRLPRAYRALFSSTGGETTREG